MKFFVGSLNFWVENKNLVVCKSQVLYKGIYFVSQLMHQDKNEQTNDFSWIFMSSIVVLIIVYYTNVNDMIQIWNILKHHLKFTRPYLKSYLIKSFQKLSRICVVLLWVRWSEKKFEQVAKVRLSAIYNSHNFFLIFSLHWYGDLVPYITAITSSLFSYFLPSCLKTFGIDRKTQCHI